MKDYIMKILIALLFAPVVAFAQQTRHDRPVDCYNPFTAVMKEMKMEPTLKLDTAFGTMGVATNGTNVLIYEYVKKIDKVCVYAEGERV
jgi:hypothetical protein